MGFWANATAANSSAFGYLAVATQGGVVSFGHAAGDPTSTGGTYASARTARLIHVSAGTADTDAVNKGQLDAAIGGISSYTGFDITADGGASSQTIASGGSVASEADDANGNLTVIRSGNAIRYGFSATPTFNSLTVGGAGQNFTIVNATTINMGGNVVGGVAAGVANTDAVHVGQLNAVSGNAAAAQAAAAAAQTTAMVPSRLQVSHRPPPIPRRQRPTPR